MHKEVREKYVQESQSERNEEMLAFHCNMRNLLIFQSAPCHTFTRSHVHTLFLHLSLHCCKSAVVLFLSSVFLGEINKAFDRDPELQNLLLDSFFSNAVQECQVNKEEISQPAL